MQTINLCTGQLAHSGFKVQENDVVLSVDYQHTTQPAGISLNAVVFPAACINTIHLRLAAKTSKIMACLLLCPVTSCLVLHLCCSVQCSS